MRHDRSAKGFTLIELLVVIAIIVVLISILMPSLSRAREQVKTVVCLSNIRQLGMAFHSYAGENQGNFPPVNFYHSSNGPTGSPTDQYYNWWPNKITSIIPVKKWKDERTGNMDARDGANKAWTCPGLINSQFQWCGGYAVAENIVRYADQGGAYKFSQVNAPANLYLVGDAWQPVGTGLPPNATCITIYPPTPVRFQSTYYDWALGMQQPAQRHYDNFVPTAFYDGHGESMKFADLKANKNRIFEPAK